jgi:hypothetical protein
MRKETRCQYVVNLVLNVYETHIQIHIATLIPSAGIYRLFRRIVVMYSLVDNELSVS